MDPKSEACVFLGYSLQHKGYKCLNLTTGRMYVSRHVLFDEGTYPFHKSIKLSLVPTASISSPSVDLQFSMPISTIPDGHALNLPFSSHIGFPSASSTSTSTNHLLRSDSTTNSSVSAPSISVVNTHPMVTRLKAGIYKPKAYSATKHPLLIDLEYVHTT